MEGSFNEFLQIAQVSAPILSHDHIVTALHFLISKHAHCFSSPPPELVSMAVFVSSDMIAYYCFINYQNNRIIYELRNVNLEGKVLSKKSKSKAHKENNNKKRGR